MATKTMLGVSPGTRSTGIAVIRSGRLTYWKIHSFPGIWSYRKLKTIVGTIEQYARRYHIDTIAVKIPDVFPSQVGYNQLIGTLNVFCERKQIAIRYYTHSEIKQAFDIAPDCTVSVFLDAVVAKYPELLPEYQREQRNLNKRYYHKVFEAVAVAHRA